MQQKNQFEKPELTVEELSHALYEANLKLLEANERLQLQEKQRLEFYANISHDLRAPMTALSNSVEYLLSAEQGLQKQELHETLLIMQRRTKYLEHLINDIFLLSSLDSSNDKVHKEPVDMRFFLEDYFYLCEADSKYVNAHLELDIPDSLELTLMIDPILIQRLLDNLFANALKYAKGTPYIKLSATLYDTHFQITVSDHGIGIAPEYLDKIFERSYIVSASRTPGSSASSGFGLAIVKSIAEHHGATVRCQSILGEGSQFIIDFSL